LAKKKLLLQEKVRASGRQEGQEQARGETEGKEGQETFCEPPRFNGGSGERGKMSLQSWLPPTFNSTRI